MYDCKELLRQAIASNGPTCSLNHWDMSEMYDLTSLFSGSDFDGDISPWTFSPYLDEQGFRTMFTSSTASNIGLLVLPMQSHCSISDMFLGDNNTLNLLLLAQAEKNGWSRYHWDAIVDGTASNLWVSEEAVQYAEEAKPILKALGMNNIQMAESLLQTWPTRQFLGEGLVLPTLD